MDHLSPSHRDVLLRDIGSIQTAMFSSVTTGRSTMASTYASLWSTFCEQHHLDPYLSSSPDPIPWLQVFACQVRDGRFSASGNSVRSSTVADALHFVSQTFTLLGKTDPRLAPNSSHLDFRLARQLRGYAKSDPPPIRVKPIPLSILHRASLIATTAGDPTSLASADMMWLAFFFLLRPGEYSASTSDSHPFRQSNVQLWSGSTPVDPFAASPTTLLACTFVALTFETQKNGIRAEQIGHGRSLHPVACPVLCVVRRILYLRSTLATPSTFLCSVGPSLAPLPSIHITTLLRSACLSTHNFSGFHPSSITARSLRASGATALLNRAVDPNTIQLLGRWRSDSMLRYLHVQAHSVMQHFSSIMLSGGAFNLIPTTPNTPLPPF